MRGLLRALAAVEGELARHQASCAECSPECYGWLQEQAQEGARLALALNARFERVWIDAFVEQKVWHKKHG